MDDLLLAIDNGTQSVRALAFNLRGELVAKAQIHIEPYFSKQPGWAEQQPQLYWDSVCEACHQLWQEGVDPTTVKGMSVTTQRATMVNLDADGEPLRPAIVWLDQRLADNPPSPNLIWRGLFKLLGISDTIASFRKLAKANWIAENEPELWAKTDKYVQLSGYLHLQLTGQLRDSTGSQVGYVPFDYKKRDWADKHDWKWQSLPVRPEQLPELVLPGEQVGCVTEKAAQATGIPAGLPVIASGSDKACEIIGAGCLEPQIACLSYGTTATCNIMTERYLEPVKFLPPYPAAIPGYYYTETAISRGYWMVSWFKQQFGYREQRLAEQRNVAPEALFDQLIEPIPPGSMGLTLQPYWSPGVRDPGPEAKGAIIGFGDVHTRAHVYRAILEGVAYALREGKEQTEKASGTPITELRVSGGGSQSNAAMQLTADIFNLPAIRPHTYETSGLGAAIVASVSLGLHADVPSAIAAMTRPGDRFEPNPEAHRIYDQLYKQVYRKMYAQLGGLYTSIRKITGYPR